jgi:hypothetical protein
MKRMKKDYLFYKKYLKSVTPVFLHWLLGFWEGEGYIEQHKNTNYNFVFNIVQKDVSPLNHIRNILQIGTVRKVKHDKSYILRYDLYRSGYILALLEYFLNNVISYSRKNQLKKVYKKIKCILN